MKKRNRTDKIKKIILMIFLCPGTIFIVLFMYRNFSKIDHNVSREDVFSVINEDDDTGTDSEGSEAYGNEIAEGDFEDEDTNLNANGASNNDDSLENNSEETDNDIENEEIEDTDIDTPTTAITAPDLTGMDEATAISICSQNGYKYNIEYYLGGNGNVISQSPTSSESIEAGGKISINIGISQSDFSNKLLGLINEKRRTAGLGDLNFSEQLNTACNILAQENVNSVDCIRPDGSHWSSVLWENGIWLSDGTFTTRNNITSLSNTNERIKYVGNSFGDGNLLTASYTMIGMAYSSNNMLVIIIGC